MKIEHIKPDFVDSRGAITDLLVKSGIGITYIFTEKGAVRGNHYHKKTVQYEYILNGELMYYCRKGEKGKISSARVSAGDLVCINPREVHTFKSITDSEILSFNFLGEGNSLKKDTYKPNFPIV
jgi:dTDP-4-dehydrorhamnose 3,5-epimerase